MNAARSPSWYGRRPEMGLIHPYDAELRFVAEEFGHVLSSAVMTIDRWGLKTYHLRKHVKQFHIPAI